MQPTIAEPQLTQTPTASLVDIGRQLHWCVIVSSTVRVASHWVQIDMELHEMQYNGHGSQEGGLKVAKKPLEH